MKHVAMLLLVSGVFSTNIVRAEDPQRILDRGLSPCNMQHIAEAVRLGANVNVESNGRPPLSHCVRLPAVVAALISAGADVNAADKQHGTTPLMEAARSGLTNSVELLLAHGAAPDQPSTNGVTALMYAAENAKGFNIILHLLAAGADANAADRYGETPLMGAARKGLAANVQALLQAGADPQAKDADGRAVVWSAVDGGQLGVLQMLAKAGADIDVSTPITILNPVDPNGVYTPLMAAANNAKPRLAELLLELGARAGLRDINGKTALQIARARGNHAVTAILTDAQ